MLIIFTLDVLGSKAFTPVKSDLTNNIKVRTYIVPRSQMLSEAYPLSQKVRERQLAAPAESETLQALVVNELKTKKHVASEGLLWLVRYVYLPTPAQLNVLQRLLSGGIRAT